MKKAIIIFLFLFQSFSAKPDVIYFPYQYAFLCYSIEAIYNYEIAMNPSNTLCLWAGGGMVGSFLFLPYPFLGLEGAVEFRHYSEAHAFRKFFISGYLGTAYVTNFQLSSIGIIPGLKINYKFQNVPERLIEPYLSLSLPISYSLYASVRNYTFPVLTVGVRFGFSKLRNRLDPKV
ncbi:MAG: hypothetical protein V2I46_10010 [Bacteroides sp.]|jgi:hypothetical protein|nr:hypothetical protein [Bacteroides sp.]